MSRLQNFGGIITTNSGNFIKFGTEGKKEKLVTLNKLKTLRCIAVDYEDNIYCIDNEGNKILTCDRNGSSTRSQANLKVLSEEYYVLQKNCTTDLRDMEQRYHHGV